MTDKQALRRSMRTLRRDHVAAQSPSIRALLFARPPAPLLELIPSDATIGLYHATENEAPTAAYAKFFHERGHDVALPRFASHDATMEFAAFTDPFQQSDLERGPFDLMQPALDAERLQPDVVFLPLLAFTERGERLGQGGGHYDRWIDEHPVATRIGMGWDVQLVERCPIEPHDHFLHAVVTPTRLFGPFI